MVRQLVVLEDDPGLRQLLRAVLVESRGASVWFADHPDELAPATFAASDAVLVDLDGFGASALKVVRRLRAEHPAVPVVVTTADAARADGAIEAGASASVLQPFSVADLLDALDGATAVIDLTATEVEVPA